jgi:hypothetical protein
VPVSRLAIMQPYVFPYLGYFHLIEATDLIVFFDDVAFRKRGWIHRNRILLDGREHLFTIPVSGASQNKLIHEVGLVADQQWLRKFQLTLRHAYGHAPHFGAVSDMVASVLRGPHRSVADLAIASIAGVYDFLDLPWQHTRSSVCSPGTRGLAGSARLIRIAQDLGADAYVNAPGGRDLYHAEDFREGGLELHFVESLDVEYDQLSGERFVPALSILDVLMFNDKPASRRAFKQFRLLPGK